jgi:hypothetical protein
MINWTSGTPVSELRKARFELAKTKNHNSGTRILEFGYMRS